MSINQSRVELPAYTDHWMMGDRYGTIVNISKRRRTFPASASVSADDRGTYVNIAHVRLDKSGKTVKVVSDDCKDI